MSGGKLYIQIKSHRVVDDEDEEDEEPTIDPDAATVERVRLERMRIIEEKFTVS